MRVRFYSEDDDWSTEGAKITSPEVLDTVRKALEKNGTIIVEHRFYRGSCAPDRLFFDDFDEFLEHLNKHASAGDNILVWGYLDVCRNDNWLAIGKCPDDDGRVPHGGAY